MADRIVFGAPDPDPPKDDRWEQFRAHIGAAFPKMTEGQLDDIANAAGSYWRDAEARFGKKAP